MSTKVDWPRILDASILLGIGLYSLAYSRFGSNFAELHMDVPGLGFPVFLGEILLIITMSLWLINQYLTRRPWSKGQKIWAVYFVWILVEIALSYGKWGPFTLRNAALFYYPFFAFLCFYSFRPVFINPSVIICLALLLLGLLVSGFICSGYFWMTYVLLAAALIWRIEPKWLRIVLMLVLLIGAHWEYPFKDNRTLLICSLSSIVFVFLVLVNGIFRIPGRWKIGMGIVLTVLIVAGVYKFSERERMRSLTSITALWDEYQRNETMIRTTNRHPETEIPLSPRVYNPNRSDALNTLMDQSQDTLYARAEFDKQHKKALQVKDAVPVAAAQPNVASPNDRWHQKEGLRHSASIKQQPAAPAVPVVPVVPPAPAIVPPAPAVAASAQARLIEAQEASKERLFVGANINILFRIFIWEDMTREMWRKKAWLGLGFGWPQWSTSLEILNWGQSEWQRDGWVAVHNSFLHIVYRAGIIGVGLIFFFFYWFRKTLRTFIAHKSIAGVCLMGVFVFWLVAALFDVIFELPYYAIPFWALFGLTAAFAAHLKTGPAREVIYV